jgi:hypothetical protein
MEIKDIIIGIISLVLAYFMIKVIWIVARSLIQTVLILIIAYVLYLFLKKLL